MAKVLNYSDDLWDILVDINDKISNTMMDAEGMTVPVGFAEYVDVSDTDFSFDVVIDGKKSKIKIGSYVRTAYPDMFLQHELVDFIAKYNILKGGGDIESKQPAYTRVEIPAFKFNPKDVRSTFISLVTETYPHGHEEEVVPFISGIGLQKDQWGNYYKVIGKSTTMFTSHLDTADRQKSKVNLYSEKRDGDEILRSDGTTILGADDKSGVAVMLYMMAHNIPGVYYFFLGEERGGIGSGYVAANYKSVKHLEGMKKCVSFDRRNYYSVITSQFSVCCSDEFGTALCKELSKGGLKMKLDPTGVFTDSAQFVDVIPECTNISVGYFEEHTRNEHQNITFLEKLAKACLLVNWENLPIVRTAGLNADIVKAYGPFLNDFESSAFTCFYKMISNRGESYIKFSIDQMGFDDVKEDIFNIGFLLNKHKLNFDIYFDDESLLIELDDDDIRYSRYFSKYMESFKSFNEKESTWNFDELGEFDDWDKMGDYDQDDAPQDDEDEIPDDPSGELCYWLRKMYAANGLNSYVESDGADITAYVFLEKRVKFDVIMNVFETTDKIKTDLLSSYDVEVELYESKEGKPVFKFDFIQESY
jgi:hypothetical protein